MAAPVVPREALGQFADRFLSHYGMAAVLALLCLYYSWATWSVQQPRGAAAAHRLARQFGQSGGARASVLIIAKPGPEDDPFAETLEQELRKRSISPAGIVRGDPPAVRGALERLARGDQRIEVIATTAECASWTVLQDVPKEFPALGHPRVVFPAGYRWPTFLKAENLLNIANQIAVVAVVAVGMTLVILTGGIDLSVGSLLALAAVVSTLLIRDLAGAQAASAAALWACSAAGIGACAVVGAFSGLMITVFRIPPFIATLATMQVASGLAYILAKGGSIYEVPAAFGWLGRGTGWLSVPNAVWLTAAIFVLAHLQMKYTRLGRHIYAVGSNASTARLCGVRVGAVLLSVYALAGALAGLGGIMLASQLKSGSPSYGVGYELYVIAAVVVGGTSLSGGEGRIFGTLIGALIIAVIQNGMNLTGVESYTQKIVLGLVILGAVLLDSLKHRGWRQMLRSFTGG